MKKNYNNIVLFLGTGIVLLSFKVVNLLQGNISTISAILGVLFVLYGTYLLLKKEPSK